MVADQLKWVTGLSKKTTVNEIIYVVLKKCNINAPELKSPTLSSSSSSSSSHKDVGYKEYVLAELNLSPIVSNTCQSSSREQNQESSEAMREISSELIIDGDSLVYKHIDRWLNPETKDNILLKILQRDDTTTLDSANNNGNEQMRHTKMSLGSKIMRKLGFGSSKTSSSQGQIYKYVDVKLPKITNTVSLNSIKLHQVSNPAILGDRLDANLRSISFANLLSNQPMAFTRMSRPNLAQDQPTTHHRTLTRQPNLGGASVRYMKAWPSMDFNASSNRMTSSTSTGYLNYMSSNLNEPKWLNKNPVWDVNNNEEPTTSSEEEKPSQTNFNRADAKIFETLV